MKTLSAIEKEVEEEFEAKFPFMKFGTGRVGVEDTDKAEIMDFFRAALRRVAEEMFTEVMPGKQPDGYVGFGADDNGWADCRAEIHQNFIKFTEKV